MNWRDISYLQQGTIRQQQAYRALVSLGIFEALAGFDPVLVGTIPIDLDLPESDLDIICEVNDLDDFERVLYAHYRARQGSQSRKNKSGGDKWWSVISSMVGSPSKFSGKGSQ